MTKKYQVHLTVGKKGDSYHGTVTEDVEAISVRDAIDKAYGQTIYKHDCITGVMVYDLD
jgi:hypothetical protein